MDAKKIAEHIYNSPEAVKYIKGQSARHAAAHLVENNAWEIGSLLGTNDTKEAVRQVRLELQHLIEQDGR